METLGDNQRTFFDTYSATGHRLLASAPDYSFEWVLGLLRLDSISTRSIVIPDSHLFDGSVMLENRPSKLLEELSRSKLKWQLPIEIRTRAGTLEASLAKLLERDDSDYLNYFTFSAIQDEATRIALG